MVFDRPNERSPEKLVTTNSPSQDFLQPEDENKVSLSKFLKRSTFIVRLDLQFICFSLLSFSFDSKHSEFLGTAKIWNDLATFERLCYLYRKIQSQCCKLDVTWNKSGNVERSRCQQKGALPIATTRRSTRGSKHLCNGDFYAILPFRSRSTMLGNYAITGMQGVTLK